MQYSQISTVETVSRGKKTSSLKFLLVDLKLRDFQGKVDPDPDS